MEMPDGEMSKRCPVGGIIKLIEMTYRGMSKRGPVGVTIKPIKGQTGGCWNKQSDGDARRRTSKRYPRAEGEKKQCSCEGNNKVERRRGD